MPICDRCKKTSLSLIMSRFNTDMICDDCENKEKNHPAYAEAVKAELNAVKSGNYNFPGIGKPRDL
jgi:hypothetical protein